MDKKSFITILTAVLMALTAAAQVQFNGKNAAVDNLTGTWLLTVPESTFGSDYTAAVTLDTVVTQCLIDGMEVTDGFTFSNVQPGATYRLQAVTGNDTIQANIQFTYWPVIQIYGNFVKRPYYAGTVIYSHPDSSAQETISSRVRWAGSSTAGSDRKKRNFHLKFYNEDGSKKEMSFFGLRSDFHWRLDAGQVDFARVRNRVSKDIWAFYAHEPYYAAIEPKTPRNYIRGDFVEVFLNDEYMGIYSLNEHMDRQQLKLKPYDYENGVFHGGLWKPMQWSHTTVFNNLPAVDATRKTWDQFYVKYPNIDDVKPTNFQTLYDAINFTMNSSTETFLDSAKYYFDIPVMRDYYLHAILMQAPDNVGKNLYYACYDVATDKRLTMALWDQDCTQGQFYINTGSYYHHAIVGPEVDFRTDQLQSHLMFYRLWTTDPSFHGLATERYWELRATTFNPDSILARYMTYFDRMKRCGADQREIARWSRGSDLAGHELNFDNELEYLRDWWTRHIAYLDENIFVPYPMGDVNFDHQVTITDVTRLISYILGQRDKTINMNKADMNKNGNMDITDVVRIINLILSGQHSKNDNADIAEDAPISVDQAIE